jgi:hypothetical protein
MFLCLGMSTYASDILSFSLHFQQLSSTRPHGASHTYKRGIARVCFFFGRGWTQIHIVACFY